MGTCSSSISRFVFGFLDFVIVGVDKRGGNGARFIKARFIFDNFDIAGG